MVATPEGVSFPEPAPRIAKPLSPEAALRFAPLDANHFEYVHIIFRGSCTDTDGGERLCAPATHVRYSVPSAKGGAPYANEHMSLTRSETVEGITGLTQAVIFPAARAKCPDLADPEAYPPLNLAHVEYVGVEGGQAVAQLRVPSLLEGLNPLPCPVSVGASKEALDQVHAMKVAFLVPAIKAETGLR
jgi:hypothetical protein